MSSQLYHFQYVNAQPTSNCHDRELMANIRYVYAQ